jgi:Phytanoyl-CoA dioxygenase (PhyH)
MTPAAGAPPARPWYERADAEAVAARGLSGAERRLVEAYRRDGFVVVEDARILDAIDVAGLWERLGPRFANDGAGRVQDAWSFDPAVRAIATHPAVLATLRLLYGREPYPFQTLNFLNGTEQNTHSDTIHFSSLPHGFMCGVWLALEDVTLRQGPLHYYRGSHALPAFDYTDFAIAPVRGAPSWDNPDTRRAYGEYEGAIARIAAESGCAREELAIPRGAYLIWSANLLHGGSPRADAALTRKSQVTHYYFDRTVAYTPMFSRRDEERLHVRLPCDVRTGRVVKPSLDGVPVVFPGADDGLHRVRPLSGLSGAVVRALPATSALPASGPNAVRQVLQAARRRLGR